MDITLNLNVLDYIILQIHILPNNFSIELMIIIKPLINIYIIYQQDQLYSYVDGIF